MLDIKFIRENPKLIKETCRKKRVNVDIDRLLEVDKKRRNALVVLDGFKAEKNKASKDIAKAKNVTEKKEIISLMRKVDEKSDKKEKELKAIKKEFNELMLKVPNIILGDVPEGKDESENKPIRQWGKIPKFDFEVKDHTEIGKKLDIIDIERAAKVSGARFAYFKKEAALLELALINFVFKTLASPEIIEKIAASTGKDFSDKTFVPIFPPAMIRPEVFAKMARLSDEDKDDKYYLPKDDLYLIGSAEHTIGSMYMNETISEKKLPLRYVGFSSSFRREAGSYGKDTKGVLRAHQFDKLEMESFSLPENSLKEQDFFVAIQEYLMQSLELPYQVVMVCAGDMGKPDARQIDIEAWIPSQNKYRETHSADLMNDFQARRLNTKVRRKDGKTEFIHMNDATAFAIGRTLIAIIENNQQKDGSVKIPKVLQQYTGFKEIKKRVH